MRRPLVSLIILILAAAMVIRPEDLPEPWSPVTTLYLDAEPNFVSRWKVRALAGNGGMCRRVMNRSRAAVSFPADHRHSDACHIRNHTRLAGLSFARLVPLATTCAIAARLYLWEVHDLQPAAQRHLGAGVARIRHYASFACRGMRTTSGVSTRRSQHATANAVDIAGFVLTDGRKIPVLTGWPADGSEAAFLRAARDGLCRWFNMVLSPDYNALHADHFHADMGRWPGCR